MKLTERQSAAFHDWIRRKVESPTCNVCGSKEWRIGEIITATSDSVLEDVTEPDMVQLICKNCAHVLLFDAKSIEGFHAASPYHDPSRSAVM